MKKEYLLYPLKSLLIRLVFIVLSVFFLIAFTWLLKVKYGFIIYSSFTTLLCFGWLFSEAYNMAERDLRAKAHVYPLKGAAITAPIEIITVILLLWVVLSDNMSVPNVIYAIWNAPFAGFLAPSGELLNATDIGLAYYLMPLFFPLFSGIGYYSGLRHFATVDKYLKKFIYKGKNKE